MENLKITRMFLPLLLVSTMTMRADIPAFPGADGPGAVATGGRGGDVYHVTRLDADKEGVLPGSLQYGINNTPSGGRTIVFDVGGTIYLAGQTAGDTLRYGDGNLTIAGQTAPGPGITIAGTGTKWTGTNVILRNITIIPNKAPVTYDAFSLQVKNSILDHVSAIWFTDEGISISDRGETTTVQYANISEGLNYGGHSFGSIITTEIDGTRYSFNHNLYAHNGSRMPRIGAEIGTTGSVLDFTNNVLYNWSSTKVGYGGLNQPCSTNFINNYYINGYNNQTTNLFVGGDEPADSGVTKVYESGNKLDSNRNGVIDGIPVGGKTYFREGLTLYPQPFFVQNVNNRDTADVALQRVLAYSGANWQRRSPTETRIINSVRDGSGAGIAEVNGWPQLGEWEAILAQRPVNGVAPFNRPTNFDTDNDGLPDTWETAHGTNPSVADHNGDFDNDGYRNIEEYINDLGAWPASDTLVFTNANANGRYAEIGNWGNLWQPSRYDTAQINAGTVTIDAPAQHARSLSVAANAGDVATLSVDSGWLDVRETLFVGSGGAGSVTQSGGVLRAGASVTLGGASSSGSLTLTGGTLAASLLTKGAQGGIFTFSGGILHADTVAFSLTNAGGTLAPGSDFALQQMAVASMPDINNAVVAPLPRVGSTRVVGDLVLQGGSLEIDINSISSFDKLSVDNALTLGGALTVIPAAGYTPSNGSRWLIATAASISGNFSSVTAGYGVEIINGNSLYLVALSTGGTGSTNVTVAADGTGQYARLQDALNAVPTDNATPHIIHIKPGTYTVDTAADQFMADSPKITLNGLGGNPANVIVTGAFNSAALPNDRYQHATIVVLGNDFTATNVTFANTAGDNQGQALAIYAKADRLSFVNCRFLGWQDTLRAEHGRQYFENCYIEGDVDFIYGHATGYFKNCSLYVKSNGYVTAPDTLVAADHRSKGFVFEGCTITGATANTGLLGRPWNAGGLSVFLNTKIGPVIKAEGWGGSAGQATFAEYRSTDLSGTLLDVSGRTSWSTQLTAAEITSYSQSNWLSGPDNWIPFSASTMPPATPTGLSAMASPAQIALSWSASSGAVSYSVRRATVSGGPYSLVATPSETNYTDSGLVNGTTYHYVVSAVNSSGESAGSAEANATPQAALPQPPPPPASLTATGGNGRVTLSWPASTGAVSYSVKRATVTGGPYIAVGSPTGASFADTSVVNGTTYYYIVSAINTDGESAGSPEATATPLLAAPPAPTSLGATASNTQIGLSWATASSATSYNVKRATTSGGPYTTVATPSGNSYMSTGLINGTTYYFVVSAVNAAGESPDSSQVSATPFSAPVDPSGGLKIDINHATRNQPAQTEPGYTMWSSIQPSGNPGTTSTGLTPITQTFATANGQNITVSFAQTPLSQSRGGTGIASHWFQVGAQGAAKLVSDGIMVAPTSFAGGGEIVMTIAGLAAGPHTLLTYHNGVDNPATGNAYGPMDVYLNGTKVISKLQPTIRAATNLLATTAYFEFSVSGPEEVVTILFSADPTAPNVNRRTPVINGFEIDTPNTSRIANTPSPSDVDEHADADIGAVLLGWKPALSGNIVSHDVYFGTDPLAVRAATRNSPEFKGTQSTLNYLAPVTDRQGKYYWRIDETDNLGNTTKGNVWYFRPRQLAFPGAEGYGRHAIGGRRGKVVKVTSLADYRSNETPIPGTLRYAIEQETAPRTIVFDVSGLITLNSRLTLNQPYVTIAGQTAPGKGITTRGWALGLSGARDSVIRYFRNRPGNIAGETLDGGGLQGCDFSIMDHCSISWSIDEAFTSRNAKNITLQRTLISEALNIAGHDKKAPGAAHGFAATISGDIGSFHHNLLAHNDGRNWSLGGGLDGSGYFAGRLDIRNNVVYNWRNRTTDGGAMEVNFVNNYYIPGPATVKTFTALTINHENAAYGSQRAYFTGNVMVDHFDETNQEAGRVSLLSNGVTINYETFVNAPFFPHHVETDSARDAYKRVMSDVGANAPIDDHDIRVISETLTRTYTYTGTGPYGGFPGLPNSQDDVGGWEDYPEIHREAGFDSDNDGLPDWWEKIKGLNPNSTAGDFSEANADTDNDGYTNLEDYLNWLAVPHATVEHDRFVEIDLAKLTRGFTNAPVHAVLDAVNGTVSLAADGKTAIFVPTRNIIGLGSFRYTVLDAEGSSMSGVVNLHIFARPPEITTTSLGGTYGSSLSLGIQATHLPTLYGATGLPPGLEFDPLTGAITGTPTAAGTYEIVISATNVAGTTSVTLIFTIDKALATLTFADQLRSYTGSPVNATAATNPAGLNIVYTYDGGAEAPTYPGAYDVIATINEPNYLGSAVAELSIAATAAVSKAPHLDGDVDGSIQLLTGASTHLHGSSMISLDLLVPGLPTVRTFGDPNYAGTIDADGATTPSNYTIMLHGRLVLRHTVRRVDPIELPTVDVPPAPDWHRSHHRSRKHGWHAPFIFCPPKPAGHRSVKLDRDTDSIGDFATLCHLLHNHHSPVAIPPGTYGDFSAHGRGGFIFGVAGATEPAIYNLQHLTLTGQATLQIVGPVILRVADDVRFDGNGTSGSPVQSLTIEIAKGDLSVGGRATLNASVIVPKGKVTIGGRSVLNGRVQAEGIHIHGEGLLKDPEM